MLSGRTGVSERWECLLGGLAQLDIEKTGGDRVLALYSSTWLKPCSDILEGVSFHR